jgi:hypothetical protein
MTDIELGEAFAKLIPLPPRHYRQCRVMLARQMALRAAGPQCADYFNQHQARLISKAGELIATSTGYLFRYRLNSPARKWLHKD